MSHRKQTRGRGFFCGLAVLTVTLLAAARPAAAGYYSTLAASGAEQPKDSSGAAQPKDSSGGLHTVVVMSLNKCTAALGRKQARDIETHYINPYMECMRRLRLKAADDAKKKADVKKTAAQKESASQKGDGQKTNANSNNTNGGGYYRVPQKQAEHAQ